MKSNDADRCTRCGSETEYTQDTSIELKKHYVEGASQLYEKCCAELYGKVQAESEEME